MKPPVRNLCGGIGLFAAALLLESCNVPGASTAGPSNVDSAIHFKSPTLVAFTNIEIIPDTLISKLSGVMGYTVSPSLPAGLILDPVTGLISGTPTATSAATSYTVLVFLTSGFDSAKVNITVLNSTDTSTHGSIPAALMTQGQERFEEVCVQCHGTDAKGYLGSVPPLYHSDFLMDASNRHRTIRIQMMGLPNPFDTATVMIVNGDTFEAEMPSVGGSDSEIAAVLTYVRATFNGATDFITVQEVAKVRDSLIAACHAHSNLGCDGSIETTH